MRHLWKHVWGKNKYNYGKLIHDVCKRCGMIRKARNNGLSQGRRYYITSDGVWQSKPGECSKGKIHTN